MEHLPNEVALMYIIKEFLSLFLFSVVAELQFTKGVLRDFLWGLWMEANETQERTAIHEFAMKLFIAIFRNSCL